MKNIIYHTIKDVTYRQLGDNKIFVSGTLTGLEKDLKVGDEFRFNGTNIRCTEIIEQRKHSGRVSNPKDSENAFFEAKFHAM